MLLIIKRDGRKQKFDLEKLKESIKKASIAIKVELLDSEYNEIVFKCREIIGEQEIVEVEKLQDTIEKALYLCGHRKVRESFKDFRKERTNVRETKSSIMRTIQKISMQSDKGNANVGNNFGAKLLSIASEASKWQNLATMPKHLAKHHEQGDYHLHDVDSFDLTINCCSHSLDPIKNGFKATYGTIRPAKRLQVAAELACIFLESCQNHFFGGQSIDDWDNDMSYFVELSRQEIYEEYKELMINETEECIREKVEQKLEKVVQQSMQSVMYNLSTMESRSGSQIVFSSLNIGLPKNKDAALICKYTLQEYKKGLGNKEALIFPNIAFAVKSGVNRNPEDEYYYLFKLACKVASTRLNPTFLNMDTSYNLPLYNNGIRVSTMG